MARPLLQAAVLNGMPALMHQRLGPVAAGADHDQPAVAQIEPEQIRLIAAGMAEREEKRRGREP